MQNEELQRVFNLSENQNHRYNGYMLPLTNDKPAGKVRKLSPKKKNVTTDMVTATSKPAIKRSRPKVKNCINSDSLVNGFPSPCSATPTTANTPTKAKSDYNPYAECFDTSPYPSKFNNFVRPKVHHAAAAAAATSTAAADSTSNLVAKLACKDGDVELNRKRLTSLSSSSNSSNNGSSGSISNSTSSKYDVLNHLRPAVPNHLKHGESSSSSSYSRLQQPQRNHVAGGEFVPKTSPNNVSNRNKVATSYLQMSVKSGKRFEELREKESDYSNYLPKSAPSASSAPVTALPKPEIRFLDDRKIAELQQQQQQPILDDKKICEPSSSSTGTATSISSSSSSSSKLFLRAKRRKQSRNKWQMDSGTRHEALQRIRYSLDVQDKLQNDLFPLNVGETGYEKSDSDSSEEYANTFQDNWFHMSEIEFDDVKRNLRLAQLYSELQRQLSQIKQNKCDLPTLTKTFMKSLVDATRTRPTEVTHCIQDEERQRLTTVEPIILTKKKCALEGCKNVALPCMPTCIRHILLCEKQTLFEQCRVRDSNSFQCDRPVLNIKYHYPVCSVHSKPDFVLPDFARPSIPYDEVRGKNVSTLHSGLYRTDFDMAPNTMTLISASSSVSSKGEMKKRNNVGSSSSSGGVASVKNHSNVSRPISVSAAKKDRPKEKKVAAAITPAIPVVVTTIAATVSVAAATVAKAAAATPVANTAAAATVTKGAAAANITKGAAAANITKGAAAANVTKGAAAAIVSRGAAAAAPIQKKEEKLQAVKSESAVVKSAPPPRPPSPPPQPVMRTVAKQVAPKPSAVKIEPAMVKRTSTTTSKTPSTLVPAEVNQNLLPDWVNLSENQLVVDTKSLETNLPGDFVNGFDISAPSIQSHIQEMINSEPSLSTDILMESNDLPNYIQVEEMIEEVEVTDETLESNELNNQELVRSEDLNAVLKELPPEAFNELFSDKNDSQWTETQALERVIEEMDVRKCALIDPSLLLEDIEPSYSNYSNNYEPSLSENVDTKFNDIAGNCSQSES